MARNPDDVSRGAATPARSGRQGKREPGLEATALARQQLQLPAVQARDAVGDGEAQPGARGAAARLVPAGERLLEARRLAGGDAGTPVEHGEDGLPRRSCRADLDLASRMARGVGEEVIDQPV